MNDTKNFWKILALAAAGMYVYQIAKENNGTLAGNRYGVKLNPEKIVNSVLPWVDTHPITKEMIRHGATKFLEGLDK